MIAKYHTDLWRNPFKRVDSNVWTILVDGARTLACIILWRIANGRRVEILEHRWINDVTINGWPIISNMLELEGKLVAELLMVEGEWNRKLLHELFD